MRAALKHLQSPDIVNLATYCPEEPKNFCFLLQMMVGPDAQEGAESFDVTVCTPQWLAEHCPTDAILVGRHHLLVMEYDFARIQNYLRQLMETCVGKNWEEVALQVGRLGKWEFEDYAVQKHSHTLSSPTTDFTEA
jgi:hypothetical protein